MATLPPHFTINKSTDSRKSPTDTLTKAVESGENFSQLVADIDKVRSLFVDTKIDVFKHVMSELERLIALLQESG